MIKGQRGTRVQRTGKDDVIIFLFLLYINDLNNVSTVVELILFADDTNLFMSHKDPVYLATSLNSECNKLSAWFKANKLSLNLKKKNFMLFKPRQKKYHFPMQISVNEQRIKQVKETVKMELKVMRVISFQYPVPLTWDGRDVERAIIHAPDKQQLWAFNLAKCWTIKQGQKVVDFVTGQNPQESNLKPMTAEKSKV